MSTPIPLPGGRYTVPGNRWDLLDGLDAVERRVSVVVPYYDQQADLDRLIAAVEVQSYPRELIDVVIADDGSPAIPVVESPVAHRIVRQADQGFRAAAARNLGAAAAAGDVLCFLDADMVPDPRFLAHVTRLPSLAPDALVVGRRRHADLAGWPAADVRAWLRGSAGPAEFDEPEWLRGAYARSRDLLDIDAGSYRFVISALMCCSRELFDDIGGFDEAFVGYGGEDWEFAHRAVCGGALLHHSRSAIAWHNGPDWAGREVAGRAAQKNREALRLAAMIPDPRARRHGLRYALPRTAVHLDADAHTPGSLVAVLAPLLQRDVGVWLDGATAAALADDVGAQDDRIRLGPLPESVLHRCPAVVHLAGRTLLPADGLDALLAACAQPGVGRVESGGAAVCEAAWATNRARRWRGVVGEPVARTVVLDPSALGIRTAECDPDLSW